MVEKLYVTYNEVNSAGLEDRESAALISTFWQ